VFEAGEAGGILFIAMRYARGGDVRTLLTTYGALPAARTVSIITQAASALDAAHRSGLVHRDVKPANLLLDQPGGTGQAGIEHVYLSDFGLSKAAMHTTGLTKSGMFLGTLDYIAPEQIEGKPVDGRADQYALACAAYELISGQPPFRRDDPMAVMYAHLHAPAPGLAGRPAAVDEVFRAALSKPPAWRYPSCGDFAAALSDALGVSQGTGSSGGAETAFRPAAGPGSWPPPPRCRPPEPPASRQAGPVPPSAAAASCPADRRLRAARGAGRRRRRVVPALRDQAAPAPKARGGARCGRRITS